MKRSRVLRVSATLILAPLLAGCAGEAKSASPAASQQAAPDSMPPGADSAEPVAPAAGPADEDVSRFNACTFLTKDQVAAVIGQLTKPPFDIGPLRGRKGCIFEVRPTPGTNKIEHYEILISTRSSYRLEGLALQSKAVTGLGDEAWDARSPTGSYHIWVAKGGLSVAVFGPRDDPGVRIKSRTLVSAMVAKL